METTSEPALGSLMARAPTYSPLISCKANPTGPGYDYRSLLHELTDNCFLPVHLTPLQTSFSDQDMCKVLEEKPNTCRAKSLSPYLIPFARETSPSLLFLKMLCKCCPVTKPEGLVPFSDFWAEVSDSKSLTLSWPYLVEGSTQ